MSPLSQSGLSVTCLVIGRGTVAAEVGAGPHGGEEALPVVEIRGATLVHAPGHLIAAGAVVATPGPSLGPPLSPVPGPRVSLGQSLGRVPSPGHAPLLPRSVVSPVLILHLGLLPSAHSALTKATMADQNPNTAVPHLLTKREAGVHHGLILQPLPETGNKPTVVLHWIAVLLCKPSK